ncbi:hypothetical protein Lesp02_63890 [Lentzea sp. NBRC 105346]|uniref:peptidase inhibitor family I36 protein n=1 Tax=Lentzea sp. NBRC 105346 TaxID=3032205 RepID=UPI0024A116A5|nr:peptidase inhibitor family I36 protein [Lentzea sp. NBRC 105346]GLZ34202.1 hypothetical protein Lesp02_63890 [Lentzea sp. NBRC 105346]
MPKHLRTVLFTGAAALAMFAAAPAAQAADTSCADHTVCLWPQPGFRGDKLEIPVNGRDCTNVRPLLLDNAYVVRSLKVGTGSTAVALHTERNCRGTRSVRYAPGAQLAGTNFSAKSVR